MKRGVDHVSMGGPINESGHSCSWKRVRLEQMPFPPVMRALAADPSLANSVEQFFERRKGAFEEWKCV